MAENENKKPNWFVRTGTSVARLYREIKAELKKVIWPNRTQLTNNTLTVLLFCLVVGAIIWLADAGLTKAADVFFAK